MGRGTEAETYTDHLIVRDGRGLVEDVGKGLSVWLRQERGLQTCQALRQPGDGRYRERLAESLPELEVKTLVRIDDPFQPTGHAFMQGVDLIRFRRGEVDLVCVDRQRIQVPR